MPVATNWLVSIVLGQQDAGPAAGEQVQRHIGDFQLLLTKNHSPRKLFGEPWGEEGDRIDQISHLAARAVDTPASGRGFHFLFQCPQPGRNHALLAWISNSHAWADPYCSRHPVAVSAELARRSGELDNGDQTMESAFSLR